MNKIMSKLVMSSEIYELYRFNSGGPTISNDYDKKKREKTSKIVFDGTKSFIN